MLSTVFTLLVISFLIVGLEIRANDEISTSSSIKKYSSQGTASPSRESSCTGWTNKEIGQLGEQYCFIQSLRKLDMNSQALCGQITAHSSYGYGLVVGCIKGMQTDTSAKTCLTKVSNNLDKLKSFSPGGISVCGRISQDNQKLSSCMDFFLNTKKNQANSVKHVQNCISDDKFKACLDKY